jgi:hypothetical protein
MDSDRETLNPAAADIGCKGTRPVLAQRLQEAVQRLLEHLDHHHLLLLLL